MEKKYLVSRLPLLMKDNGIKNFTELSILTGIEKRTLELFEEGDQLDFELINDLTKFFQCRHKSLVTLEREHSDYSFWLKHDDGHNGVVYFLKADNGLTKIGWTANLKKRKETLECTDEVKTELVHYISTFDCPTLEKVIHKVFAHKRVKGEWFNLTDEDLSIFKGKSKGDE